MEKPKAPSQNWSSAIDFKVTSLFAADNAMVIVEVERQKKQFSIHKQRAFDSSPYCHAAFGGNLEEGRTGILKLPDENAEVFSFVVDFIYRKTFGTDQKPMTWKELKAQRRKQDPDYKRLAESKNKNDTDANKLKNMWSEMIGMQYARLTMYAKIWKLADYLQMPALQNLAMSRLYHDFEYGDNYQDWSFIRACYGTADESPIHRWIADVYGLGYRTLSIFSKATITRFTPSDFLVDVCLARQEIKDPIFKSNSFHYELSRYLVDEKPVIVRAAEKIVQSA